MGDCTLLPCFRLEPQTSGDYQYHCYHSTLSLDWERLSIVILTERYISSINRYVSENINYQSLIILPTSIEQKYLKFGTLVLQPVRVLESLKKRSIISKITGRDD